MSSSTGPQSPQAAKDIRLAVVVPSYGNWDDTVECLRLLGDQSDRDFHVFLADDGSPEPPPEAVRQFSFVTYMRHVHSGFAATCAAAAEAACDEGFTHLLLLNNDTAFGGHFIQAWRTKVREFPDAILGPIIHEHDRPEKVWYSGGARSIAVPFMRLRRRYETQTAVDVLTACVLLIPAGVWRQVGGFDRRFVTYYEDFDFVLRAREDGVAVHVVVEPELRVWHKVSRTTLRDGRWTREYRMIASRLLFIRRRYAGVHKAACMLLVAPHLLVQCVANLPELPAPGRLWKAIREGLAGVP